MWKIVLGIILAILIGFGAYIHITKPCYAGICPSVKCLNSSICGSGCFCGKDFPEPMGRCYSASVYKEALEKGIQVLP